MFQNGMARSMWPEAVATASASATAATTPQTVSDVSTEVMKSSGSPIGSDNGKDGKDRYVAVCLFKADFSKIILARARMVIRPRHAASLIHIQHRLDVVIGRVSLKNSSICLSQRSTRRSTPTFIIARSWPHEPN